MVTFPGLTPVTPPDELTVAVPVAPEVHVPPLTDGVSVVTAPWQTVEAPDSVPADGVELTVIIYGAMPVPQPFVTV